MADRIIGLGGKLLGIGKKKAATVPAAATEQKGPIVTQLGAGAVPTALRRKLVSQPAVGALSDKLGG